MKLKTLLYTSIATAAVGVAMPNINHVNSSSAVTTSKNTLTSGNDVINQLAAKYETNKPSEDLIASINLNNFLSDINSSPINNDLNKAITPYFPMAYNSDAFTYYWYSGNHGTDMQKLYTNKIIASTNNVLSYVSTLSLISDIAHYYGDNTSMNPVLRSAIIAKDINVINEFANQIKDHVSTSLDLSQGVFKNINDWAANYHSIVDDVVNQVYNKDPLLYQFNDINYENLTTYNGTLTASDQIIHDIDYSPVGTYKTGTYVGKDTFTLGNDQNHNKISISFNNNIDWWIQWAFLGNINEFSFGDPTNFIVQMN